MLQQGIDLLHVTVHLPTVEIHLEVSMGELSLLFYSMEN